MMHLGVQYTFTVNQYTEKVQKLRNWTVLVHYHIAFFPSLMQTILSISLCGLTFFRLSCPLQVPHRPHWTVKVGRSREQRSSLTRYRLPDSPESPVWKSNSNRRKACRDQRYTGISQSAEWTSSLVKILVSISHSRFSISHFTVNCLQEVQLKLFFFCITFKYNAHY